MDCRPIITLAAVCPHKGGRRIYIYIYNIYIYIERERDDDDVLWTIVTTSIVATIAAL